MCYFRGIIPQYIPNTDNFYLLCIVIKKCTYTICMKKITFPCLLVFFLLYAGNALAQDDKYKDLIKTEGLKNKKWITTLSLLSDFEFLNPANINPGLSVSAGMRILYKPKIKEGKSAYSKRVAEREIYVKPTFGYIYRKRFNTGFFFIPELAYRHTMVKGFFVEVNADVGYLYNKLNAPVYERQPDGTFTEVNYGFHNLLVGGKLMGGYDFSKNKKTPLAINFGAGVFYRYPSNQKWIRHIYTEVGLSYVFRRIKE